MNYSGTRIARSSPPACNGRGASPERKGVQENGAGSDKSLPIITVDIADIPGGGQLHLLQCGTEFSIQFGDDELMGSRDHESEKALARLTQERLAQRDGDILIGGLGMGFTLGAALDAWSQSATITVAELVPKIISWANGPLMHLFGTNLTDPRV
ncbi:spermidine synthase, partial [Sphingobium yanoikuyae]|nr:spermidine synthase [Sphingobium yanoikuyae]